MARTLLVVVLVPVAMLVGWLALGRPEPPAEFRYATPEPRTIDPQRVSILQEIQISASMFEGLTRLNAETLLPEPATASHWEVSPDRRVWTFHLRPEARWSTGEPVTAGDFRAAWLRVLDPAAESQYGQLLFVIQGAERYYRSRLNQRPEDDARAEWVGIEAVAPDELRVTLEAPCSYFLELTSFITMAPVHRPTIERYAYRDGKVLRGTAHLWTRPGRIVCNGPFIITRWDFKSRIRLERNPHYWDAASIRIASIDAHVIENTNAALVAYETGAVDYIGPLERGAARSLRDAGRRDFHIGPRFGTTFYRVNCKRPPLDNPDLRKALSLAIDREALCEYVLRLGETPAYTYVPPSGVPLMPRRLEDGRIVHYQPPAGLGQGLPRDARLELAREHLRRSGFDQIAGQRPIEILFSSEQDHRLVAEATQAMWERDLGIRVELRQLESKVISSRIRALDYDLARSNWFGDYLDPTTFLDMFITDGGQNRTGWSSARYDELLRTAAREPDDEQRFALLAAAERILVVDELPIIPAFHRTGNFLLSPRFEGLYDNPRDLAPIHRVRPRR